MNLCHVPAQNADKNAGQVSRFPLLWKLSAGQRLTRLLTYGPEWVAMSLDSTHGFRHSQQSSELCGAF